ncbi:MAG: class I SAM-dependent methyltransferase [Gammaproteobacteria bacterium]|nr:class I SAM-dependent methyltransferase [Gammaproteobacteria bacterium]
MLFLVAAFGVGNNARDDKLLIRQILVSDHRSEANKARDSMRHPEATLKFFGLESDMTLVEILPGGGWYAEILAPFMKDEGTYYAAHFSPNSHIAYQPPMLQQFKDRVAGNSEIYEGTIITNLYPPTESDIAPPNSADMALTFRNVHNWIQADTQNDHFAAFYKALKPGGILGVVEHRANPDSSMEIMKTTGYVTQDYVIELAQQAGFEFVESSEINANLKDSKDYPAGVWTLPPISRLGEQDLEKYLAIGESDRMTLKFIKPEN